MKILSDAEMIEKLTDIVMEIYRNAKTEDEKKRNY